MEVVQVQVHFLKSVERHLAPVVLVLEVETLLDEVKFDKRADDSGLIEHLSFVAEKRRLCTVFKFNHLLDPAIKVCNQPRLS